MHPSTQCHTQVTLQVRAHKIDHNPSQPPVQHAGMVNFHGLEIFHVPYTPCPSTNAVRYPRPLNPTATIVSYSFAFLASVEKTKLPLIRWMSKDRIAILDYIYDIDVYGTGQVQSLDYLDGQYGLIKVAFQNFQIGEITEVEFYAHILVPVDKLALTLRQKFKVSALQCRDRYFEQLSAILLEDRVDDGQPVEYIPYGPHVAHEGPFVMTPIGLEQPHRQERSQQEHLYCDVGVQTPKHKVTWAQM
ncbi:uncharacterized protein ARMOST_20202 [Armillaria ostoyae]|uniref:Uncharacterized protein n=1 Tax=Armillaria ostoyae TaxID=47428 RepID=A0A284S6P3_ARMOS|nr:uncharacterized protein ARMOST_20202 [Armillaria ostoyae]